MSSVVNMEEGSGTPTRGTACPSLVLLRRRGELLRRRSRGWTGEGRNCLIQYVSVVALDHLLTLIGMCLMALEEGFSGSAA